MKFTGKGDQSLAQVFAHSALRTFDKNSPCNVLMSIVSQFFGATRAMRECVIQLAAGSNTNCTHLLVTCDQLLFILDNEGSALLQISGPQESMQAVQPLAMDLSHPHGLLIRSRGGMVKEKNA